jgi:hypothetical protein
MSDERIDLTQWKNEHREVYACCEAGEHYTDVLLAELKRCYEELDKWTNYATYIENVDMDCHKDASAEAGFLWKCTDCGAHFELPENGTYEREFGCILCASE